MDQSDVFGSWLDFPLLGKYTGSSIDTESSKGVKILAGAEPTAQADLLGESYPAQIDQSDLCIHGCESRVGK